MAFIASMYEIQRIPRTSDFLPQYWSWPRSCTHGMPSGPRQCISRRAFDVFCSPLVDERSTVQPVPLALTVLTRECEDNGARRGGSIPGKIPNIIVRVKTLGRNSLGQIRTLPFPPFTFRSGQGRANFRLSLFTSPAQLSATDLNISFSLF